MLRSSFNLFLLRELPWSTFNFPRWQPILGLTLLGILMGCDFFARSALPEIAGMPFISLGITLISFVVLIWFCFPIITGLLRWWMKRGGRWDGQGDMFNLLAASWLFVDFLSAGLAAIGVPALLILPLWLYSIWVSANALSGAITKASLAYSIGGIVLTLIPMMAIYTLVMTAVNFVMVGLSTVSPSFI